MSYKRIAYDGGTVGAAASKGVPTTTYEAESFSGTTLATASVVKSNVYTYDSMGRVTGSTDSGNHTATAYTPSATAAAGAGPLLTTAVTNPLG